MAGLTGLKPGNTYKKIITTTAASLGTDLTALADGAGTTSSLQLSTIDAQMTGAYPLRFREEDTKIFSDATGKLTMATNTRIKLYAPAVSVSGTINSNHKITSTSVITAASFRGTGLGSVFLGNLTGNVTGNTTGVHTGAVVGNVSGNVTGAVDLNGAAIKIDGGGGARFDGGTANTIKVYHASNHTSSILATGLFPAADKGISAGSALLRLNNMYAALVNASAFSASTADINAGTGDNFKIGATTASSGKFTTLQVASTLDLNSKEIHFVTGGNVKAKYYATGLKFFVGTASLLFNGTAFSPVANSASMGLGKSGNAWGSVYTRALTVSGNAQVDDIIVDGQIKALAMKTSSTAVTQGQLYNASGTVKIKIGTP